MRAIDTNVLVLMMIRDDAKQLAAAEEFVRPGAWVSHLVLMEALWVLGSAYGVGPARIMESVGLLLDNPGIVVQDADVVRTALENFRKRPALGFSDCLILEVARKAGHLPLGTFDRELGKLNGAQKL